MKRANGNATLRFLGAAATVTGSKHLLSADGSHVLLDCGQFQGRKDLRRRNWDPPDFDAAGLDAVILSHAHIDHSGYLPVLVRRAFRGPIHCTRGTHDLLTVLLEDAARLQEEEAAHANRHGYSRHRPALPLFTTEDVRLALRQIHVHDYGESFSAARGLMCTFRRAGHILGSATVQLDVLGHRSGTLLYTGDLGRRGQVILRDPEPAARPDVLLVESTYGDRLHHPDPAAELARIVREAAARGGALLIPAFAVGRTQTLIWMLRELEEKGAIPVLPVAIDSPMANRVSDIYCRHDEDLDADMLRAMDHRRCPLCCKTYELCSTPEQSKSLNDRRGPMIVLAGSGMVTGGRILHHLARRLSDPETTVLLVGYQAMGTRGRSLQDGTDRLKLHGRWHPVRAQVEVVHGLSAHADRDEMLQWLSGIDHPPRRVYIVHGEPTAAESMALAIRERLGWNPSVARDGECVPLFEEQR